MPQGLDGGNLKRQQYQTGQSEKIENGQESCWHTSVPVDAVIKIKAMIVHKQWVGSILLKYSFCTVSVKVCI